MTEVLNGKQNHGGGNFIKLKAQEDSCLVKAVPMAQTKVEVCGGTQDKGKCVTQGKAVKASIGDGRVEESG